MNFDLLIYCVGYETRSGYIASKIECDARIGIVFDRHHIHRFEENLRRASTRQDTLVAPPEGSDGFIQVLASQLKLLRGARPPDSAITIAIDVSSMTRRLMTAVVASLHTYADAGHFTLSILYAPGEYITPPKEGASSFIDFAPAPGCEGWTKYPERPLSVVLGLGYEADQAIGAIEYLDPSGIWAFIPVGSDPRFLINLKSANEALWPLVDRTHRLEYAIDNPYLAFSELRGLVASLSRRSRVVIVPGGPKLFSALSILAKLELGEEVSIWRASTHEFSEPRNITPAGDIVRFDYKKPRVQLYAPQDVAVAVAT